MAVCSKYASTDWAPFLWTAFDRDFNVHPGAIREPVFRVGELSLFQDFSTVAFHIDLEDHFERGLLGLGAC